MRLFTQLTARPSIFKFQGLTPLALTLTPLALTTMAALRSSPGLQAMYQVHKNVRPDGAENNTADEFIANRDEQCAAHFIKLSVAPDAKTYTLSIPATGHSRTFQTRAP